MHLDRTARRVLGALLEKRFSTPEQYPLTLNALVLACNQRSNRDPFMDLEPFVVEGCLTQLRLGGFLTVVERDTGRVVRYKERLADSLGLTEKEAAVVAELLLRGPQTEQELARRTERMRKLAFPEEALQILDGLAARKIVEHLPRRPGERIARWRHLFTPPGETEGDAVPPPAAASDFDDEPTRLFNEADRAAAAAQSGAARPATAAERLESERTTRVIGPGDTAPPSPPRDAPSPWETTTKSLPVLPHAEEIAALQQRVAAMERTIDDLRSEVRGLRAAWDELRNGR